MLLKQEHSQKGRLNNANANEIEGQTGERVKPIFPHFASKCWAIYQALWLNFITRDLYWNRTIGFYFGYIKVSANLTYITHYADGKFPISMHSQLDGITLENANSSDTGLECSVICKHKQKLPARPCAGCFTFELYASNEKWWIAVRMARQCDQSADIETVIEMLLLVRQRGAPHSYDSSADDGKIIQQQLSFQFKCHIHTLERLPIPAPAQGVSKQNQP